MFNITVLGSSSDGNCIHVDTGDFVFLLDAGLTHKDFTTLMRKHKLKISNIECILVTHEHSDHIRGLEKLVGMYDIPVISSCGTLLSSNIGMTDVTYVEDGTSIRYKNCYISSYKVPHDTNEPLCFSIENSVGEKLLYLTDCGSPKGLEFPPHDIYIIEANYEYKIMKYNVDNEKINICRMLRASTGKGHLEINETIQILKESVGEKTSHIVLSHLSSENSNKEDFINKVTNVFPSKNVLIAKEGLNIKYGKNPKPF